MARWMLQTMAWLLVLGHAPAGAAEAPALARLGWLSGCWEATGGEPGSGEQWMAPAGGVMFGVSRTIRGGRSTAHEFMQVREPEVGRLVFIAQPSGQPEGSFALASQGDSEVVFENPQHDFPQRVIYRLEAGDRLLGRIEGTLNGRARSIDFPMRRVACAGAGGAK